MNVVELTTRKKVWILIGVMLGAFMASLDSTIVSTALPTIISDLNGLELYTWPFTIYMLCMAVSIPIFGRLADVYGFKVIYFIGITLFLTGSALCGISQSMIQFIIFRGIQGIGGGMLTANALAIIGATFSPAERAKYLGIGTSIMALSSIVGPSLGGTIVDNLSWHWVFYINIPVGILAIIVILLTLPKIKERVQMRIDWAGIVVFILGIVPLLLAFTWAGDKYEWGSFEIIGMLAFSLIMGILFVIIESRSQDPIVPMKYFRNGIFNFCALGMMFSSGISIGAVVFLPLFLQGVIGVTATNSGMLLTPLMLSSLVAATVGGGIISKTLRYKVINLLGFLAMTIGMYMMTTISVETARSTVTWYMVIVGLGMGLSLPVFSLAAQNAFPQKMVGSVTSMIQFFRLVGATIISAVFGTILNNSFSNGITGLNLGNVPEQLKAFFENPQAISNPSAMEQVRAMIPVSMMELFNDLLGQIQVVLTDSVVRVFTIGLFFAIGTFLLMFFLKEIPLRKELIEKNKAPSGELQMETRIGD